MKHKNSAKAKKQAINNYRQCLITGSYDYLVGCHIYPAGSFPELRCYDENIIPLTAKLHTTADNTFDWIEYNKVQRTPLQRIDFLFENGIYSDFQHRFKNQLYSLCSIIKELNINRGHHKILEMILENYYL